MKSQIFDKVVLIHGIRTQGGWSEMVAKELRDECEVSVTPLRYGYFDVFSFLIPGATRSRPVEVVMRELRGILQKHNSERILVIAHSFGTYVITKILSENPDIRLGGLILCGSVVSEDYRWDINHKSISNSRILNECGDRDIWPNFAKSFSWGYGPTGRLGFGVESVRDRFHNLSHSGFFTKEFVLKNWVPLVRNWEVVDSEHELNRGAAPWWFGFATVFPIKLSILALAVTGALAYSGIMNKNSNYKIIPPLDTAISKELVISKDQLIPIGGTLTQKETLITENGYFNFEIPVNENASKLAAYPEIKTQAGVILKKTFNPNLYITVQVEALSNINTIDLTACNVSLVVKRKSRAIFFWSLESDASPRNIPINVDTDKLNTIALRQVGSSVAAFINGELLGEYTFKSAAKSCAPSLQFKVNPDQNGMGYFQGLAIYEFR